MHSVAYSVDQQIFRSYQVNLIKSCRTDILAIKGMQRNMFSDDIEAVTKINSFDCETGSDAFLKPSLYMKNINTEQLC